MKLSEAIREGAKLHEQAFGSFFKNLAARGEPYVCTCALGAALEGAGVMNWQAFQRLDRLTPLGKVLRKTFPELDLVVKHPEQSYSYPLNHVIMSLNDNYSWSREDIAKWLEGQGL